MYLGNVKGKSTYILVKKKEVNIYLSKENAKVENLKTTSITLSNLKMKTKTSAMIILRSMFLMIFPTIFYKEGHFLCDFCLLSWMTKQFQKWVISKRQEFLLEEQILSCLSLSPLRREAKQKLAELLQMKV